MEYKREKNKAHCTCTYEPCTRNGICWECLASHREHEELPGCVFPLAVELTYDRSIACFVACKQN